jgi:SAM-dependent methyltransferase
VSRAAAGGDDLEAILESAGLNDPDLSLLVITFDAHVALPESVRERTIYVVPPARLVGQVGRSREQEHDAAELPMSNAAFDVVLGHRLVRPGFDATPLLREALRVTRPDGSIVLAADPRDFQWAPLPPAAPVYLTQRALVAAGLPAARFTQHRVHSVAVIPRRATR